MQVLEKSHSLVHLDVTANQINSRAAAALMQALTKNESLYCLIMSSVSGPHQNNIKSEGVRSAARALAQNCMLGILNLSGNMLGNDGLAYIVDGLCKNKSVLSLNVSQVYIDHNSVDQITRLILNSRVCYLDLSKNRLGNAV